MPRYYISIEDCSLVHDLHLDLVQLRSVVAIVLRVPKLYIIDLLRQLQGFPLVLTCLADCLLLGIVLTHAAVSLAHVAAQG